MDDPLCADPYNLAKHGDIDTKFSAWVIYDLLRSSMNFFNLLQPSKKVRFGVGGYDHDPKK